MRFTYHEWNGEPFPTQNELRAFDQLMDYVLEYGPAALDALRRAERDPEQQRIIQQWIDDGMLDKVGARFRLTPRAANAMQRRALMEIFKGLKAVGGDGHETRSTGVGGERVETTRAYRFGDSLNEVDLNATLRNAIQRAGSVIPVQLQERDLEVYESEARATCSTVILLDMSGSMGRWERFTQAKKCAMALFALIRQRFPLDTVDVVGFASGAEIIPEIKLPLAMPKRISTFDPQVRIRVPLDQLNQAPQHFTNLQLGLMTARQLLARRGGVNKQVFIITDGQPTAHVEGNFVHLIYPPETATALATLTEALYLSQRGVRFSTFALIEDYFYMDWVGFVDQLTKLTKGVAFYCTSGDLSQCVMESYLSGRKTKAFLA